MMKNYLFDTQGWFYAVKSPKNRTLDTQGKFYAAKLVGIFLLDLSEGSTQSNWSFLLDIQGGYYAVKLIKCVLLGWEKSFETGLRFRTCSAGKIW